MERSNTGTSFISIGKVVAKGNISIGEIFSEKNLTTKRPGNGISPMKWDSIIGRPSNKDYCEDELIIL